MCLAIALSLVLNLVIYASIIVSFNTSYKAGAHTIAGCTLFWFLSPWKRKILTFRLNN